MLKESLSIASSNKANYLEPNARVGMSTTSAVMPNEFANISLTSVVITSVLSLLGLIIAIVFYILFTKWCCCKGASVYGKCRECCGKCYEKCCGECYEKCCGNCCGKCTTGDSCQHWSAVGTFTILHFISKPVLIIVNIVYLAIVGLSVPEGGLTDILGLNQTADLKATGAGYASCVTFLTFIYEIGAIIMMPIFGACIWVGCWKKNKEARSCRKYLEYLRFNDLEIAFIFAPFSNVNLFYLGPLWYIAIAVRLACYSVTFAAAVIAGVRAIISFYCCICCECACNDKAVELRSYKQAFVDIGLKMVVIALKLMTCSSALSTYLEIGILVDSIGFRIAYFSFTMLRGATALFSLTFTAAMLRWAALKEGEKKSGNRLSRTLGWLDKYEPHVHVSFFIDMLVYGGLLVLNFMIIHGINNNDFTL